MKRWKPLFREERPKIKFGSDEESEVYTVGDDEIFFRKDRDTGIITVAMSEDGDPYSHTNHYIEFKTSADASEFLQAAQKQGKCPHGWD